MGFSLVWKIFKNQCMVVTTLHNALHWTLEEERKIKKMGQGKITNANRRAMITKTTNWNALLTFFNTTYFDKNIFVCSCSIGLISAKPWKSNSMLNFINEKNRKFIYRILYKDMKTSRTFDLTNVENKDIFKVEWATEIIKQ